MNKIIILVGISGSGKSTWAKDYVQNNPNTVIVSRDSIRMSLYGYDEETYNVYYEQERSIVDEREKIITKFFDSQVSYALAKGMDVVADNTHLNSSYINAYKKFGAFLKLEFFDEGLDNCIKRDLFRTKYVGSAVIKKQFKNFEKLINSKILEEISEFNKELEEIYKTCKKSSENDSKKPDSYVFDLDGCLAHTNGKRSPYDWTKVSIDDIDVNIADIVNKLHEKFHIIICTGRDASCREDTIKWLVDNGVMFDEIYMRSKDDRRKDNIVKPLLYKEIQKKYKICGIFEDRARVVSIGRKLGYLMLSVAEGDF